MTRVLVLGATGMLGHKVLQRLSSTFDVIGAARQIDRQTTAFEAFAGVRIMGGLNAGNPDSVSGLIAATSPDVVVNCVGVIKQREATEREEMVRVNSLFPHVLARESARAGARLIHLSTDCVFSGERGMYREADRADPVDAYGSSKLLGEPDGPRVLTIRTSMIGRELRGHHSLLEWFLRQPGPSVRGYVHAIFSGLTNIAIADEIGRVIAELPDIHGMFHVAAAPIAKATLLEELARAYGLNVRVVPDEGPHCDRSLDAAEYRAAAGFTPPSWERMVRDLADDPTPYRELQALAAPA